ncbi:hypothetical protein GCM10009841_23770 [Microlunatus panaciterrae]|uniref:DNA-binding MarR family transcriptional regulator n=1 Tax=Microlunatus panaciterrae TaxID=400768 RepID=A0ABS2REV6_9ACTN|nr:MarR family transcriptional regulator [Microlunatus panaciterrae]MBM7797258.1 DNA-binding MarR family transcriptional regulator [Microlunatus panaciterrae]
MNADQLDASHPPGQSALATAEREITRFLRRSRMASQQLAASVHPDLDPAGYGILVNLFELSATMPHGVRASDLGAAQGLHKSTTSRNIADLEALGLIRRVPDPSDARARLVQFTPSGEHSLRQIRAARRLKLSQSLSRWPAEDVENLSRLLRRLGDDLL